MCAIGSVMAVQVYLYTIGLCIKTYAIYCRAVFTST
jgi:hypothetical protein